MSKATRIKQAIRITVISTLVFYFGLIALLNLPAVQHRISTYAARELTRLTQAEVSIGNVNLGLLNRVVIQNVQIKDRQKKDMLGISRFSVKIDIPSLLSLSPSWKNPHQQCTAIRTGCPPEPCPPQGSPELPVPD